MARCGYQGRVRNRCGRYIARHDRYGGSVQARPSGVNRADESSGYQAECILSTEVVSHNKAIIQVFDDGQIHSSLSGLNIGHIGNPSFWFNSIAMYSFLFSVVSLRLQVVSWFICSSFVSIFNLSNARVPQSME
jgi:hypothetical protein